ALRAPRQHRRGGRLDRHHPHRGLALLEHLPDAGDGAAGADAADHDVDPTVGVPPDLLRGGAPVNLGIGRVRELLRMKYFASVFASSSAAAIAPAIPSAPGVRISSAPYARSSSRRSTLIVSGIVSTQGIPRAAHTIASAIP